MSFSDKMVEDVKEAFELFSNTDENEIFYHQTGDVIRALGECPTNEDVLKILGNPTNDELKSKKMAYEDFLPILEQIIKSPTKGTFEDFIEGMKVFDKDGNGTVMGAEIRHVLTTLGEKLTPSEVATMMTGQEDSSGIINYGDFSKFLLEDLK